MQQSQFFEAVRKIHEQDPRYDPEAYLFVREALDYTVKMLDKPATEPGRHVSGQELLEGIREYAVNEFGPMALTVLKSWGVTCTADIGEMVFNLVNAGILGKTDEDRREDFAGGYDFHEAFAKPFQPRSAEEAR
ncbi:MAG: hypothetical protein FJ225_01745 [Lentisphaerae bacterium]|nr:hypothetical protein [Lentisphaerota bacterium]